MTTFLFIVVIIASSLAGFAAGRIGDRHGGHVNAPHHWIYGLLMVVFGFIFFSNWLFWAIASFGIGLFISDLEDFLKGKVWGVDEPHKWKFWSLK
jgi:MFS family permease